VKLISAAAALPEFRFTNNTLVLVCELDDKGRPTRFLALAASGLVASASRAQDPAEILDHYRLLPRYSTLHQTGGIAGLVADRIADLKVPVVFDPVMVATSGGLLADAATIAAFERLMTLATLTTPNVPELAALGGAEGMARRGVAYLAKGGDAEGAVVEDRLVRPGQPDRIWRDSRIETRHTHGTGCTLASAIATGLGAGMELEHAIEQARAFVRAALIAAPGFGAGHGPLGHAQVKS